MTTAHGPRYALRGLPAKTSVPATLNAAWRCYIQTRNKLGRIEEWRVHPVGLTVLLRQAQRRQLLRGGPFGPTMMQPTLFGAPLYVDSDVPPRRLVAFTRAG